LRISRKKRRFSGTKSRIFDEERQKITTKGTITEIVNRFLEEKEMLVAIWAQDENNLIGKNGGLPWHLPEDLRRFKVLTSHNTLVMGRKTYEGMGKKSLQNRQTIVLTQNVNYDPYDQNVLVMNSVEDVLRYANKVRNKKVVYIAGGAHIYQIFEPYFDKLLRTMIHHSFIGNAYFPAFDYSAFKKVKTQIGIKNEKNPYDYEFETFIRKIEV
jgi:dihydrofolate reductase